MIKAVLFDLGETLINYAPVDADAMFDRGAAQIGRASCRERV